MRSPHNYTTESGKKPHSQVATYLAQAPLKPEHAHRPSRQKSNLASPIVRK